MTQKMDKVVFKTRVKEWAARLDVGAKSITVRPMRNKWASCSSSGRLTFDISLLELPCELQDYVIVHELLHFHVPNHGRLWKSLMRAHVGDYECYEQRLAEMVAGKRSAG